MQIRIHVDGLDGIDLATVVNTEAYYDDERDERVPAARTLGEVVAEKISARLTADDQWPTLRSRFLELRDEAIREAIVPIVQQAIAQPLTKTNTYGEQTGQTITMTELIIEETTKYLNKPADSYSRNGETTLQKWLRDQVATVLGKELAAVMAAEKAKVVDAVRAKAADLIAEAIKQGLGAR
ncbi:hypothetical protein [Actinoplanes rectilineatus]|uniref:hypothetical protein n=1 Tax=Actinoplanes rectilineatus TaxID=113571 RepID=UPI0005F2D92B|nr:hypothetical protein [Actinoplanes rectilineatus]